MQGLASHPSSIAAFRLLLMDPDWIDLTAEHLRKMADSPWREEKLALIEAERRFDLGKSIDASQDFELARSQMESVLEINPRHLSALIHLGNILWT